MLLFGSLRKPMPQYLSSSLNMLHSCFRSLLVWLFVFPSALRLQKLSSGFDKGPPEGGRKRWRTVAEAVTTFLHGAKNTAANAPHEIAPTGIYTHSFCGAKHNTHASSPALKSCLFFFWLKCHIAGSITGVDRQIYAAFIMPISARPRGLEGFCCWVSARPCRDVHSQLRWGWLLQEGAVRSKPEGVLVRRPAWRGTDGLQDPWQPGLWYDLEKLALNLNLKA